MENMRPALKKRIQKINRLILRDEVKRELSQRRKVYKRILGTKDEFVSVEQQRQYDRMAIVEIILTKMTDIEFEKIKARTLSSINGTHIDGQLNMFK